MLAAGPQSLPDVMLLTERCQPFNIIHSSSGGCAYCGHEIERYETILHVLLYRFLHSKGAVSGCGFSSWP